MFFLKQYQYSITTQTLTDASKYETLQLNYMLWLID